MSVADGELVADLDPAGPAARRILPAWAAGSWVPGDDGRAPDPVLGAAVEILRDGGRVELAFPDGEQPRTAMTLTAWVCWGGLVRGPTEPVGEPPGPATPTAPVVAPAMPGVAPGVGVAPVVPVAVGGAPVVPSGAVVPPTAPLAPADDPPVLAVHLTRPRSKHTRVEVALGTDRPGAPVDLDTPVTPPPGVGEQLDRGGWHHLAVLWDGPARTVRLLVDGRLVAEHPTAVDHLPFRRRARVAIVREDGVRRLLVGPVRLHRRLRTDAELLAERHADLAAHPTVDERAPLAFRLSDAADEPTLSITDYDAPGRVLHVVLENRSPFPVPLPPARGPLAGRLELRFRPGCLAGAAHDWTEPGPPGWRVSARRDIDGVVSLYVGTVEPRTLAPGAATVVTLDHVRAAGDLGAHGTHIELHYPHPHRAAERCVRVAVAQVVGRSGRRRSPLRLAVAGDGIVTNDGATPNTLRLHLANTSRSLPVLLRAPVKGVATTLVLSFDAGEEGDVWALATTDQLLAAKISVDPPDWRIDVESLDESPEWVLTPTRDQTLGPSERIEIVVEQLVTGTVAGRTRATLRLENVPDHWDDERHVDLEKALALPPGVIMMWHGSVADIPAGWVLCDGNNGTPSLVGRFVRGAAPPVTATVADREGGLDLALGPRRSLLGSAEFDAIRRRRAVDPPKVPLPGFDVGLTEAIDALATLPAPADGAGATLAAIFRALRRDADDQFGALEAGAGVDAYLPHTDAEGRLVPTRSGDGRAAVGPTGDGELVELRPAYYELCFIMKRLPAKPLPAAEPS